MTNYLVLKERESGVWEPFATMEARSSEDAIKRSVDGLKEGRFVAVPSRSWEPKSVKVETRITLT